MRLNCYRLLVLRVMLPVLTLLAHPVSAALPGNPISAIIRNQSKHHAVFCCLKKARAAQPDSIIRLYIDGHGSLYPDAAFLPTNTELRRDGGSAAWLETYYSCLSNPLRAALYARHHEALNAPWENIQGKLVQEAAAQINQVTQHGQRPLVVLIHGFNVPDAQHNPADCACDAKYCSRNPTSFDSAYYTKVRNMVKLRGKLPPRAVWLEVYWDGLQGAAPFIWGAGQLNARFAGMRFREVLSNLDTATTVRVLTHSAGGIVIAQALWNNDALRGGQKREKELVAWMQRADTPRNSHIRVGMLVPALTSVTFDYFGKRTSHATPAASLTRYELVIGRNERDYIVTKLVSMPGIFGATDMGCREKSLQHALCQMRPYPGTLQGASLRTTTIFNTPSGMRKWLLWEEHDWKRYRHPHRKAEMNNFLALVFQ